MRTDTVSPDNDAGGDQVAALLRQTLLAARLSRERIAQEFDAAGRHDLARLYRSTVA